MEVFKPPSGLSLEGNVSENWRKFKQRFEIYLDATETENARGDKKMASMFLASIGEDALEVYNTFQFDPATGALKLTEIYDKFEQYCCPRKNVQYERYLFFNCNQKEGENIEQFVTDLKIKSKGCELGDLCESLITTKVVCGIIDQKVCKRLLCEHDLTLIKAVDICRAAERTKVQVKELHKDQETEVVSAVNRKNTSGGKAYKSYQKFDECGQCGRKHATGNCPAQGEKCFKCGKKNHFSAKCWGNVKKVETVGVPVKVVQSDVSGCKSIDEPLFVGAVDTDSELDSWCTVLKTNGTDVNFKLDTGAQANLLPYGVYKKLDSKPKICETKVKLISYNGSDIPVKGKCIGRVCCGNKTVNLAFIVVDIEAFPILGLDACVNKLHLIKKADLIQKSKKLDLPDGLQQFENVFGEVGCLEGECHIVVDPDVTPVVAAPRKVPFALRDPLKQELDRMEKLGVITKVDEPSDWVNPLVVVEKPNKSLRICLDPRQLNKAIKREHFEIPTTDEILGQMIGGSMFSKCDCSAGFWAVKLDDASARLCTFSTPFSRYRFERLPFGISCAPEMFHKRIAQLFEGIEGVLTYQDDLICWASTEEEHDRRLKAIMERAQEVGLKFNFNKCQFKMPELVFLGHSLSKEGIKANKEKVIAIDNMPTPTNKQELQRFLGLVTYFGKFIPNLSSITEVLRKLLEKNVAWHWYEVQQEAVNELKKCLMGKTVLKYFDPKKSVRLSVDASQSGLGAVILQEHEEGWAPVAYASRALTSAERSYAQIEKETLAIVFGCERFSQYVYGQKAVKIDTDHKALEAIFEKPLSSCPPRIQRFLLRLQRYDLRVKYTPGKYMFVPDALSRAYLETKIKPEIDESDMCCYVDMIVSNLPITESKCEEFKRVIEQDETMQCLKSAILCGWPSQKSCPSEIMPFWTYQEELTVVDGLIMRGERIVVPKVLRPEMLKRIHEGHMGIEKCKIRAREVLFWPGMSSQINDMVSRCSTCCEYRSKQQKEPMVLSPLPTMPWQRVASDLFKLENLDYLVVVDYYSRYPEIALLKDTTSSTVITHMKSIFARHGIPSELMSDNGPQYSSELFKLFAQEWEFRHTTSSPKFPQANGLAERTVQTVKNLIKKAIKNGKDPYMAILEYRNSPMGDGLESPAKLLMGRRLNTKLPCIDKLTVSEKMQNKQSYQKKYFDLGSKELEGLETGDTVRINSENRKHRWGVKAQVIEPSTYPRSYIVETQNGHRYRRNRRDLLHTSEDFQSLPSTSEEFPSVRITEDTDNELHMEDSELETSITLDTAEDNTVSESSPVKSSSGRVIRKPWRFRDT